jgi:NADP-dependent 3-hydroxy acid dehydrogenase YdfG
VADVLIPVTGVYLNFQPPSIESSGVLPEDCQICFKTRFEDLTTRKTNLATFSVASLLKFVLSQRLINFIKMYNNITGKVVVITGASSGIGEATARHLASLGAIVSLGARRKERLDKLVNEINAAGGKALAFSTDVTKREQVEDLVNSTVEAFGKIDVIFNNAGIMPLSRIENLCYGEWESMIDVNIKGVLYGVGAAFPYFKMQKSGHFINVSSVAGHKVAPTSAVYSATKFAVAALSEGLRQEVKAYNLRTTVISPGAILTELAGHISDPEARQGMSFLDSIGISPDAIARAVAYAIDQPQDVDINEIFLRPTVQEY